jgi:hypothetical protein
MKQPKEGFYMGIRTYDSEDNLVAIENNYGAFRTWVFATCLVTGAYIIGEQIGKVALIGVAFIKNKIEESKKKKEESE